MNTWNLIRILWIESYAWGSSIMAEREHKQCWILIKNAPCRLNTMLFMINGWKKERTLNDCEGVINAWKQKGIQIMLIQKCWILEVSISLSRISKEDMNTAEESQLLESKGNTYYVELAPSNGIKIFSLSLKEEIFNTNTGRLNWQW